MMHALIVAGQGTRSQGPGDAIYKRVSAPGNSAPCDVAAWTGGEFGGERTPGYIWLSPFTLHLKLSQHCLLTGYTTIKKKEQMPRGKE